jgi:hypothetical protein
LKLESETSEGCAQCRAALSQFPVARCALCENHAICLNCERKYSGDHPMTLIRTQKQLALFRSTTPLFCGKMVNRFDFKKMQASWIVQNCGKACWLLQDLVLQVHLPRSKPEEEQAIASLF